ncbi:MAG: hypothetical protein AAF478_13095, partial [Pseudomonadota bacterium]
MKRRDFLSGLAAAGTSLTAAPALAESPIVNIIRSSKRDQWSDQFDARKGDAKLSSTNIPVFSPQTPPSESSSRRRSASSRTDRRCGATAAAQRACASATSVAEKVTDPHRSPDPEAEPTASGGSAAGEQLPAMFDEVDQDVVAQGLRRRGRSWHCIPSSAIWPATSEAMRS